MTKNLSYLIDLTYDKAYKGYVADVVNLYGCMSQGKTKKEAIQNVKKAIKAHMEVIEQSNEKKLLLKKLLLFPLLLRLPKLFLYANADQYFG